MSLENLSREELFSRIRELESQLKKNQKYGLVWEPKDEAVISECKDKYPILKRVDDKSIREGDGPINYLIEGDNYHALKVLQYTHKGKVDVIYIDPPYNTGNKDFIYNDSFVDKEDGYRHSKWLSFMETRLKLAKGLLKDTGVIFISIDDNEQAQLKLLCDGVFGERNFVGNFVWKKSSPRNDIKNRFSAVHEYVFCYFKNPDSHLLGELEDLSTYKNKDDLNNLFWKEVPLTCNKNYLERPNLYYPVINEFGVEIWPSKKRVWSLSKDKMDLYIKSGKVFFKEGKPKMKKYLDHENLRYNPIQSISMEYSTQQGSDMLSNIFSDLDIKVFDYPKPVQLLSFLIRQVHSKSALILDFFAGSGTTGHAVLELNKQDGGNRQFILVTNNGDEKSEHKIAEKITYERLKRVIKGYTNKKDEKIEGLGGNLDYFKCDFIPKTDHQDNMRLRIAENCLDTILFKENNDKILKQEIVDSKKIYTITQGHASNLISGTAVYHSWNDEYLNKFKKDIEKMNGPVNVYLNPFIDKEEFDYASKVNIKNIPDILNI